MNMSTIGNDHPEEHQGRACPEWHCACKTSLFPAQILMARPCPDTDTNPASTHGCMFWHASKCAQRGKAADNQHLLLPFFMLELCVSIIISQIVCCPSICCWLCGPLLTTLAWTTSTASSTWSLGVPESESVCVNHSSKEITSGSF